LNLNIQKNTPSPSSDNAKKPLDSGIGAMYNRNIKGTAAFGRAVQSLLRELETPCYTAFRVISSAF
jgi:hypothetical protein